MALGTRITVPDSPPSYSLLGIARPRVVRADPLVSEGPAHDLRHTCATILLKAGQHPKFVQEMLGHATIAITLDTYSHVLPDMGDQTAEAMDEALR